MATLAQTLNNLATNIEAMNKFFKTFAEQQAAKNYQLQQFGLEGVTAINTTNIQEFLALAAGIGIGYRVQQWIRRNLRFRVVGWTGRALAGLLVFFVGQKLNNKLVMLFGQGMVASGVGMFIQGATRGILREEELYEDEDLEEEFYEDEEEEEEIPIYEDTEEIEDVARTMALAENDIEAIAHKIALGELLS